MKAVFADVLDDADDRVHRRRGRQPIEPHALTDRRLAGEELSRERLVDHDGQRRAGAVAIVEQPAVDRRHAKRFQVRAGAGTE